ncbi:hypothetical protein CXB51_035260 [Gossypium anomalum]|uniref:Uncharacterized protein n=1 Tax=Gossypium anomalum TaxID=47600 RepID=A0A8J5Y2E6_9ROSI|nr:hypothetical protein CXB51_035260 [Gossypium anomalum]
MIEFFLFGIVLGLIPITLAGLFVTAYLQYTHVLFSRSKKCIVGIRLKHQVALDLGVLAIIDHEGKIISIDTDNIILLGNGEALDIPFALCQCSNKNT